MIPTQQEQQQKRVCDSIKLVSPTEKTNTNNFGTKKCTKKLATVIRQKKIQKRTKHRKNLTQSQPIMFKAKAQQKVQQK